MLIQTMAGAMVIIKIIYLVFLFFFMWLSSVSGAVYSFEWVSVQEATRHFRDSQQLLADACKNKSIERALRALSKADESLKAAKAVISKREPENAAEIRMKSRLLYKVDQDIEFLNRLRADLGMAEQDGFESYLTLRRSLIKDAEQRSNVVRMDHQILLTLESRTFN